MKKLLIAIPFIAVLAGCSSRSQFATHAPGADGTVVASNYTPKPAIPAPKPVTTPPMTLK